MTDAGDLHIYALESDEYISFLQRMSHIPLYANPWWIKAAVGNPHSVQILMDASPDKALVAVPMFTPMPKVAQPLPLTQTSGPYFINDCKEPKESSNIIQIRSNRKALNAIAQQLKQLNKFWVAFDQCDCDLTPLIYQVNAKVELRYTHLLDISDYANLYQHYNNSTKQRLKKANKHNSLIYTTDITMAQMMPLIEQTFRRAQAPFFKQSLERTISSALEHNNGFIASAVDNETNELLSSLFIAYDQQKAYYISGGRAVNSSVANDYPMRWLIDKTFHECNQKGLKTFDFEGSMLSGVGNFFQSFGAIASPYYHLSNTSLNLRDKVRRKQFYRNYIF